MLGDRAVELGGVDRRADRVGSSAALIGIGEGPVMAADCDRAHLALGSIFGQAEPVVVEEAGEGGPPFEAVVDARLSGGTAPG
jgi:hypothetical protein